MENKSRQELITSLPPELQKAISYSNLGHKIDKIGQDHSLHIDKIGDLYAVTEMVMLGLIHPNNFVSNIKTRLDVSQGVAEMIARDVNNEIFLPIREDMKKIAERAPVLEEDDSNKTSNLAHDSEHPVESDEHHTTLKREDILRDIEDPAPAPKISKPVFPPADTKTAQAPSNLPVAHDESDLPAIIPNMDHPYSTAKPVTKNPSTIVGAKLNGVVVTDTTKISQAPSTPKTPYKVDPYRETF